MSRQPEIPSLDEIHAAIANTLVDCVTICEMDDSEEDGKELKSSSPRKTREEIIEMFDNYTPSPESRDLEKLIKKTKKHLAETLRDYEPLCERSDFEEERNKEYYQKKDKVSKDPQIIKNYQNHYFTLVDLADIEAHSICKSQGRLCSLLNKLLDNVDIQKYLFGSSSHRNINTLDKLCNRNNSNVQRKVYHYILEDTAKKNLIHHLNRLQLFQISLCKRYINHYKMINKLLKTRSLLKSLSDQDYDYPKRKCSSGEMDTMLQLMILHDIRYFHRTRRETCHFFFFYKLRWPFCTNIDRLEYDFYCILFVDNRLIQFVVEYDGAFHFEVQFDNPQLYQQYHKCDIIKQYYLFRMNVHLIRLNDNFRKTYGIDYISAQISDLIESDHYFEYQKILAKPEFFNNNNIHKGLQDFNSFFADISSQLKHHHNVITSVIILKYFDVKETQKKHKKLRKPRKSQKNIFVIVL